MPYKTIIFLLLNLNFSFGQSHKADFLRAKAEKLYVEANYDSALVIYLQAFRIVEANDPSRAANLAVDISSMYHRSNDYKTAVNYCKLGLSKTSFSTPDSIYFKLYSSTGTMYKNLFQKDSALFFYRLADEILLKKTEIEKQIPSYVLYHYNNQGRWFLRNGEIEKSIIYLEKAVHISHKFNLIEDLAFIQSNLAEAYEYIGQYQKALSYRLLTEKNYTKKDIFLCTFYNGIGRSYFKQNDLVNAEKYWQKAYQLYEKYLSNDVQNLETELHLMLNLATLFSLKNQNKQAENILQKGISRYQKNGNQKGTILSLLYLEKALLFKKNKELDKALNYLNIAQSCNTLEKSSTSLFRLSQKTSVIDQQVWFRLAFEKALIFKNKFEITHHKNDLIASIQTFIFCNELLNSTNDLENRSISYFKITDVFSDALDLITTHQSLFKESEYNEMIFGIMENAKYNKIKRILESNAIKPSIIPKELLAREQKIKQKIAQNKILGKTTFENPTIQLNLDWYRLLDTFERQYPQYYQLKYNQPKQTLADLIKKLDDQTVYLNYFIADKKLYILAINNKRTQVIKFTIGNTFFDDLETLKKSISYNPGLGKYQSLNASVKCFEVLIEPIQKILHDKKRIIVSRDWIFNDLPFEILESGKTKNAFLCKRFAISYAYNAQIYFSKKTNTMASGTLVVAPFVRMNAVSSSASRNTTNTHLESSEEEALNIKGELFLEKKASKANFLKSNFNNKIVHFATHAYSNDKVPSNSYISFYPDADDKLYAEDIYNLPLSQTPLVVLSACEGDNGLNIRGEGLISLSYAFVYAGCPSVVTTVWEANDKTTAFLSIHFHDYLKEGYSKDIALQKARNDFFESDLFIKFNHPYFWSNFVLIGNYSPVFTENSIPKAYFYVVFSGLIALLLMYRKVLISIFATKFSSD